MYYWWVTATGISKKLTSLSLSLSFSLYIYINVPGSSFLYMINNPICSLSLPFSIYLFLSVHNSKFSAICANSSFSYGTSKTTHLYHLSPPPPPPSISRSSSLAIFFLSLPRPTSRPTISLQISLSLCRAIVKNSHASSTFAGTCEVINWPSGPFCELVSYNQTYF